MITIDIIYHASDGVYGAKTEADAAIIREICQWCDPNRIDLSELGSVLHCFVQQDLPFTLKWGKS